MEEKREQIGQYQKEHEDLTVQARESLKRQEEAEKAVQDADEKRMLLDQQVEEQKQTIIQTLNEKADLTAKKQRYETTVSYTHLFRLHFWKWSVVVNIPEDWQRYFRAFLCIMREDTRRNRKWKPR